MIHFYFISHKESLFSFFFLSALDQRAANKYMSEEESLYRFLGRGRIRRLPLLNSPV